MTEQRDIGNRLRSARRARELSQENVACALGIDRTVVSAMETGQRKVSALELGKLATHYQCDISWLLGEEPDVPIWDMAQKVLAGLDDRDQRLVLRFAQFLALGSAP